MNTRQFIATLVGVIVAPWKALCAKSHEAEPRFREVFPTKLEQLPGLYGVDTRTWLAPDFRIDRYRIIQEYDEWNDLWEGQKLFNPRRNKWWGWDSKEKKQVLMVIEGPPVYWNQDPSPLKWFKQV